MSKLPDNSLNDRNCEILVKKIITKFYIQNEVPLSVNVYADLSEHIEKLFHREIKVSKTILQYIHNMHFILFILN